MALWFVVATGLEVVVTRGWSQEEQEKQGQ